MASVKVSADSLEQQKKEYEKAVKNLDQTIEQIKKVKAALGKDAMLEGVREALTKLSASLETRSGVLLLMTKALAQSKEKYTAAQKKAVTKSSQFRAHNRDFYGNPVLVGSSTSIDQISEHARNVAAPEVTVSVSATQAAEAVTAAGASATQASETVTASAGVSVTQTAETISVPTDNAVTGAIDLDLPEWGSNTAAAAVGAVIGGIAGGTIGTVAGEKLRKTERRSAGMREPTKQTQETGSIPKEQKPEPSTDIEARLEAARERLRRFNEMEMEEK